MARISKKTYQGIGVRDGEKQSVILTEAVKILDATCKTKCGKLELAALFSFSTTSIFQLFLLFFPIFQHFHPQ